MRDDSIKQQVELIREVFVYAHRFRGRTFVFQIDYGIVDHPIFVNLVRDLVMLKESGIDIVLVPGARQHIDAILNRYGIEWEMRDGVRVASSEAIPFIKMAAFDAANKLMTLLTGHGVSAVIGNWVRARAIGVRGGVDYHDAGTVEKVKRNLVLQVLEAGNIPIFPCIGWSGSGRPYNISSRELAATISTEIRAAKLFFITDGLSVEANKFSLPADVGLDESGRVSRMTLKQADEFATANRKSEHASVVDLVRLAHQATVRGVDRVHIVDGRIEGVILKEIFSNLGVGTMIYANVYQSIRPMTPADVADVFRVMEPWVERGVLVERSEKMLSETYPDYVVYETDGSIHGCAALHRYSARVGEIAGVAVDEKYEQLGIGRKLVLYLLEKARQIGLKRIFLLTTQTSDWFLNLGFEQGSIEEIPAERRAQYNPDRGSRVLVADIDKLEIEPPEMGR